MYIPTIVNMVHSIISMIVAIDRVMLRVVVPRRIMIKKTIVDIGRLNMSPVFICGSFMPMNAFFFDMGRRSSRVFNAVLDGVVRQIIVDTRPARVILVLIDVLYTVVFRLSGISALKPFTVIMASSVLRVVIATRSSTLKYIMFFVGVWNVAASSRPQILIVAREIVTMGLLMNIYFFVIVFLFSC